MKIGIVIPIIHNHFINGLLDCIEKNSVLPNQIIIIDNSKDDVILRQRNNVLNFELFRPPFSFGVNASWNYGIKELAKKVDLISVLNDDLLIEKWFFEKLLRLAKLYSEAGVFCPETVTAPDMIDNAYPLGSEICYKMTRREGWAWTIRTSLAEKIPPIPEKLRTFCGDDWYWKHTTRRGRPWAKMMNNRCYHYVGQSNVIANVRKDLREERSLFKTLI